MSQVPEGFKPQEIVDQPVPLIDGTMSDASGSASGAEGVSPKTIPNIKVPRPVVASQVISESLDSQAREIKGNYTFGQMGAIQVGTTSNGVKISPDGFLATKSGVATVTITSSGDATFAGTVAAGAVIAANIDATQITGQIVNAQIANIDYAKINNVSVSSAQIQDAAITNAKIGNAAVTDAKISNLSASKITTGTLSVGAAGQVATITIARNGTNGYLRWDDGSKVWVDGSGYMGFTNTGGKFYFYHNGILTLYLEDGSGSNILGGFTVHGGLHVDDNLLVEDTIQTNDDKIQFRANGGGQYLSVRDQGITCYKNGDRNSIHWGQGGTFEVDKAGSWFHVNGTDKSAIVKTSKGYNALYCMESPEVWFMDFCKGYRKFTFNHTWKFWKWSFDTVAKPDVMFLETTSAPYVIMPTLIKGIVQIWGKRRGHENKRFEEKTEKEFKKNEEFLNIPKVIK